MPRTSRFSQIASEELLEQIKLCPEQLERDEIKEKAENARRDSLHPIERLAKDGIKLQQEIEAHDDMIAVLEVSHSARESCRARDCFLAHGIQNSHPFRIRVEGVRSSMHPAHWRTKTLLSRHVFRGHDGHGRDDSVGKFVCDRSETWGLLVRKRFQHRGQIDTKVLVEYIKEREAWDKKHCGGLPPAVVRALLVDSKRQGTDEGTSGIASSSASVPESKMLASQKEERPPVLLDYVIDEGWEALSLVLLRPQVWAGQAQFVQDPQQPFMMQRMDPWPEADERDEVEEYGPKTEQEMSVEMQRQRVRQETKQATLRHMWELLHRPRTEVSDSFDTDDDDDVVDYAEPTEGADDAERVEGAGEAYKRRRSPSDGEESEKRQKIREGEETGGESIGS